MLKMKGTKRTRFHLFWTFLKSRGSPLRPQKNGRALSFDALGKKVGEES